MQLTEVTERAKKQLAAATNLRPLLVSGADRDGSEWRLWVEMVELERIPEAQDLIGAYEVRLDKDGDLLNWRRTALRRRDETEWTADVVAVAVPPRALSEEGR
jgi:Gas vesicle synthesis protein GvpO